MSTNVFKSERNCLLFFETISELKERVAFKLIAYVAMPDHCHLIVNPRDGAITDLTRALKGKSARRISDVSPSSAFLLEKPSPDGATHQVWQDSFKAFPLWSDWMVWQKINSFRTVNKR
jgi:REP element-mobilizing transposase RayT